MVDGDTVFVVDGFTVFVVDGFTVFVVDGFTVFVVDGFTVFVVEGVHPVAASQLVVAVFTSTIRMVGAGGGAPGSAAPADAAVPAATSDSEGQYPSVSGSHRISVTAGVGPVSVTGGAK